MEKKCGIYKITNIINNKVYVGSAVNVTRSPPHIVSLASELVIAAGAGIGFINGRSTALGLVKQMPAKATTTTLSPGLSPLAT